MEIPEDKIVVRVLGVGTQVGEFRPCEIETIDRPARAGSMPVLAERWKKLELSWSENPRMVFLAPKHSDLITWRDT